MDPAILEEFRDTILIYQQTGTNEYGAPTYGTATTWQGRRVRRARSMYIDQGEHVRAEGVVYIADKDGVLPTIKVGETILEFADGEKPRVLATDTYDDGNDLEHMRVWYGVRG